MIEYDKDAIVPPYVTEFLRKRTIHQDAFLHTLEQYAADNAVPIVEPETARLLEVLVKIKKPARILEVGCAIGYSSILMAKACADTSITTLEYLPEMAAAARENIQAAGLSDRIRVIEADAKTYLADMPEKEAFDMIFLDGPKAHYIYMLEECVRLLKPDGILISDNVFYKGMTVDNNHVIRRKITIVKRLRKYLDALMTHPRLHTAMLPVGDGVTISIKEK